MGSLGPAPLPILPTEYLPIDDSHATIRDIFLYAGKHYAERMFARILTDDGDLDRELTWSDLLRDSKAVAQTLASHSSYSGKQTVGIWAHSGYSYYTHILGCWLNGWTPILLSIRNSTDAICHLLSAVNANTLIFDATFSDQLPKVVQRHPNLCLIPFVAPSISSDGDAGLEAFPGSETTPDQNDVAVYAHTSGSQGHPKPIAVSHRHMLSYTRIRVASAHAGRPLYAPLPLFHSFGFYCAVQLPLGSGLIMTFIERKKPLDCSAAVRHLAKMPGAVVTLAPSILEEAVSLGDDAIRVLAGARRIFFGGAGLRQDIGDQLVRRGVQLYNSYGATELGMSSDLNVSFNNLFQDWNYVRFHNKEYVNRFLPVDDSNLRHLIVTPGPLVGPVVINNDDPYGYATNDLWIPHPTIEGLWKHMGRKDSITVLSNGEKTNDEQLVTLLRQDPRIKQVIVFGTGKLMNGILLKPSSPCTDASAFVESVWPTIDQTNAVIPKHSTIFRHMIIVEDPSRPFVSTDKGTIRKKDTLTLYAADIEKCYEFWESGTDQLANVDAATMTFDTARMYVQDVVKRVLGKDIGTEDDLFDAGLDSLGAVAVRSAIIRVLNTTDLSVAVPLNVIYTNSTIALLASYILNPVGSSAETDKKERIFDCVSRFSEGLGFPAEVSDLRREESSRASDLVIVLTGTTGSLGTHLLAQILPLETVKSVHCLLRKGRPGESLEEKQEGALRNHGVDYLDLSQYSSKLHFHEVDISHYNCGLSEDIVDLIHREVTHIIHLAWELNFNWDLRRFEQTHVAGVSSLLRLCLSSHPPRPRFVLMSSIGAVQNYRPSSSVPEELFGHDPEVAVGGYGESKFVAEQLVRMAAERGGLDAVVVRSGQLSGSTKNGAWAMSEFMPTLVKSSLMLGMVPDCLPPVRWLPLDIAAAEMITLCLSLKRADSNQAGPLVYHLENSTSSSWASVCNRIAETSQPQALLRIVSGEEWLRSAEASSSVASSDSSAETSATKALVPAIKLLDFYKHLFNAASSWPTLDTVKASAALLQAGEAPYSAPLTDELLQRYVKWIATH